MDSDFTLRTVTCRRATSGPAGCVVLSCGLGVCKLPTAYGWVNYGAVGSSALQYVAVTYGSGASGAPDFSDPILNA